MKAVAQHLSNLIRIPSPSFLSNRPIIEYPAAILERAQWHSREIVYRDAANVEKVNLIAAPPHQDLNDTTPELSFMCHTDTVPYSADWAQALEPFITDGLLHGCGACDVKGFLACLLTSITETDPASLIDPNFRCKVQILRQQAGFESPPTSMLVRSIEAITQRAATAIPFGSEASFLASVAAEVIVFGPGDMQTAHSNRECVPLNELNDAVTCLKTLIKRN